MGWLKKLFGDEMKEESKEQAAALMATGRQRDAPIHGIPGQQLLRFAGNISVEDLHLMREAIEQG